MSDLIQLADVDSCNDLPGDLAAAQAQGQRSGQADGDQDDGDDVVEQVDKDGKGKVLVVDGGGSLRRALLGDMLAEKAAKNGWEGIVVYGCIRDVDVIAQTDLGVQALASHPLKTDKRGIGDLNVAVTFGGVTFRPGEFVYADNNGIIVSPQALKMPE